MRPALTSPPSSRPLLPLPASLTPSVPLMLARSLRHVTLGGFLGASLGLWAAFASRQRLHRAFALLRSAPKPREVIMDSGEHVKVPKEVLEYEMKEPGGVVTGLTGFFLASFGCVPALLLLLLLPLSPSLPPFVEESQSADQRVWVCVEQVPGRSQPRTPHRLVLSQKGRQAGSER